MVCAVPVSSSEGDSDDCVNQLASVCIFLEQISRADKRSSLIYEDSQIPCWGRDVVGNMTKVACKAWSLEKLVRLFSVRASTWQLIEFLFSRPV